MKWPKWCKDAYRWGDENAAVIMMVGGAICLVGAIISAAKGTVKAADVMKKYNEDMADIKDAEERLEKGEKLADSEGDDYELDDVKHDKRTAVVHLCVGMAKAYGPCVIFAGASLGLFCGAYGIISRRLAGAAAALVELQDGVDKYRKRVRKEVGDEREDELWRGVNKEKVIDLTGTYDKNGEEIVEEKMVYSNDPSEIPPWAKFFDEASPYWDKNPEFNITFLRRKQQHAQDILGTRLSGVVLLNEVYEMCGIPQTIAGSELGWSDGDIVDFGLYDQNSERVRAFINGYENCILLNFNAKPIAHLLPKV